MDVSQPGAAEYYNMCVDGAGLATVADSFAALEQRVEEEKRLTWDELLQILERNYEGAEHVRLMLRSIPRFGTGGTTADRYSQRISRTFVRLVKERPTPGGLNMVPGLFSWASTIPMGRAVGATPNGRRSGAPISHGANPDPGFSGGGSPTALSRAVALVECGYGNTTPLQIDMDPGVASTEARRARAGHRAPRGGRSRLQAGAGGPRTCPRSVLS